MADVAEFDPLVGMRLGRIVVQRPLARGGMGAVYVGWDERLKREVAVKSLGLRRRASRLSRARFLREAETLSRLEHPHICRLYDLVEEGGNDYLILELVRGRPLHQIELDALGRAERLRIALEIAQVLVAAHGRGVVHRDLKPANVMLDDEGRTKVLDFGIARLEDAEPVSTGDDESDPSELGEPTRESGPETVSDGPADLESIVRTRAGSILGTPAYMSPEQARAETATPASDMYSFGLLLQWLMTGVAPYDEGSSKLKILMDASVGESREPEGLDAETTDLVRSLKSVEPLLRPTAAEAVERLRWIRDRPRRRLRTLVAAAFVTILLGSSIALAIGFRRAADARDEAQQTVALLHDVLTSVDPGEGRRDLRVVELLEAFRPRVEALDDRPLVQASLLYTFGETYLGLGLYEESLAAHQRAYDLRRARLGDDHPQTIESAAHLAECFDWLGRFDESVDLLRRSAERARRVLGMESEVTLRILNELAINQAATLDPAERERLLREVEEAIVRLCGPAAEESLVARSNVASAVAERGAADEALALHREIADDAVRTLGLDHPQTWTLRAHFAVALFETGELASAEELLREALAAQNRILGPLHSTTEERFDQLAELLRQEDRDDDLEILLRDRVHVLESNAGRLHPTTLLYRRELARHIARTGRYEEAEALFSELVDDFTEADGPDAPSVLRGLNDLTWVLNRQGRHADAEGLYRRVADGAAAAFGDGDPRTLTVRSNLARNLLDQGRLGESEVLYRDVLTVSERSLEADDPSLWGLRHNLGYNLLRQGRGQEAASIFRHVLAWRGEHLGAEHRETHRSRLRLAQALEGLGQRDEAVELYRVAAAGGEDEAVQALERLRALPASGADTDPG